VLFAGTIRPTFMATPEVFVGAVIISPARCDRLALAPRINRA
jgi:hypothetical protein